MRCQPADLLCELFHDRFQKPDLRSPERSHPIARGRAFRYEPRGSAHHAVGMENALRDVWKFALARRRSTVLPDFAPSGNARRRRLCPGTQPGEEDINFTRGVPPISGPVER